MAGQITLTFTGFLVEPLPDLDTASLAELREAEWSGREPSKSGTGAWHVCQCCGVAKIDDEPHRRGCLMDKAIRRAEKASARA